MAWIASPGVAPVAPTRAPPALLVTMPWYPAPTFFAPIVSAFPTLARFTMPAPLRRFVAFFAGRFAALRFVGRFAALRFVFFFLAAMADNVRQDPYGRQQNMSAVEIANLVHAMAVFSAANPPVINDRTDGIESIGRVVAGQYLITLKNKLPALGASGCLVHVTSAGAAATFGAGYVDANGDVVVEERTLAGALADNAAILHVTILRFPTRV